MARLTSYLDDENIHDEDRMIGTDGSPGILNGATKNFRVGALKNHILNSLVQDLETEENNNQQGQQSPGLESILIQINQNIADIYERIRPRVRSTGALVSDSFATTNTAVLTSSGYLTITGVDTVYIEGVIETALNNGDEVFFSPVGVDNFTITNSAYLVPRPLSIGNEVRVQLKSLEDGSISLNEDITSNGWILFVGTRYF